MFRGEIVTRQSDNVSASVWLDNKQVTVMYTGYSPLAMSKANRRQRDGTRKEFDCPAAMAAYNQYMGAVDLGDQLRGYYAFRLKTWKFYKYIYNFYVGVTVTNTYIIFRGNPRSRLTKKRFQELLATELIGDYCSRRRAGRVSRPLRPLPLRHFPTKVPSLNSERKRGRCARCKESNRRSDTQWFCNDCGVWLCHQGTTTDCFLLWHRNRF